MRLLQALTKPQVARPGMTILQALGICVEHAIPGIPYVDARGRITGRFSVRHAFLISSITPDMIQGAHLIGSEALHLEHPCDHYADVFRNPVDDMIISEYPSLRPDAQLIKAMALMEKFNTSYLFVIDDGTFHGVVTRLRLTRLLLEKLG